MSMHSEVEQWAVIEYDEDVRELVVSCTGHSESRDGSVVWLRSDGSILYNGPEPLNEIYKVVKEGFTREW